MAEFGRQLADLVMMPQSGEAAPSAPALPPGTPEMKAYDPTVRERMAQALQSGMEKLGIDRYKARQNAQSIMGGPSSALPIGGIADFVPFLGTALQSQEAVRGGEAALQSAREGDYIGAGVEGVFAGLGMIPGAAATTKAVRSMRSKAKADEAVRTELNDLLGIQGKPKEQKMLQGFYRGYAGDYDAGKAAAQDSPVFVSPQRRVGEFYAEKRAAQTGEKPGVEMVLADPFAGREYGHATRGTGKNPPLMTRARELAPEDVKGRTKLKKAGGKVTFANDIDAMRQELAKGGAIKGKIKSAIKEAVKPNAVVNTYKTADGYTFYELGNGKIVDSKKPSKVDMSWPSRKEFMTDMEGTAFQAGDELGQRRAITESIGVPTQERLMEKITQFGEDDISKFYAARKKQIEDAERRAKLSVVPSGPKIDPQQFRQMAEKGSIQFAKGREQELRDLMEGRSKFAEINLNWNDPKSHDFADEMKSKGYYVINREQGPATLTYIFKDPKDVQGIFSASNPAQYGRAYGYSDEDIARFYLERGLGPSRFAEDMATLPKPDEAKASGGAVRFTDNVDAMRLHLAKGGVLKEKAKSKIREAIAAPAKKSSRDDVLPEQERKANLQKMLSGSAVKRRVYHGTQRAPEGIESFEVSPGMHTNYAEAGDRPFAAWFSADPEEASMYANMIRAIEPGEFVGNPTVYPAYLNLKNPANADAEVPGLKKLIGRSFINFEDDPYDPEVVSALKNLGYDGIVGSYIGKESKPIYISFDPKQIKSATGNVGTYDPTSAEISKAAGGNVTFTNDIDAMRLELAKGGAIKDWAKKAIKDAAESAGVKNPIMGDKDLTTLQDTHTTLGDQVRQRVAEANKMMEGFDYKYDKGQRVFTKDSAAKNKPPFIILERTRVGNAPMRERPGDMTSKVIIDPATGRAKRTPYEPGYRVRQEIGDDWSEFTIPASAIIGDVEMAAGGAVSPDPMRDELRGILGLAIGGGNLKQKAKEKAKEVVKAAFTPKQVEKTAEKMADKIKKDNPKLTDEQVMAKAKKEAEQKLQWEKVEKPALEKTYGPLEKAPFSASLAQRKKNVPEVVEKRIEETKQFLAQPTEPWVPPRKELQAFDRALIKDAMEGFPGVEQTRFPRYVPPKADIGYIEEIYGDPVNRALIEGQIKRGLPLGGETFYASLYPLKVAALERGIPEEKFNLFVHSIAPASARNSIFNEMAVGQFLRDMHARGLPLDEKTVTQEMAKFKDKYGVGLPLMKVHREGVANVLEGSQDLRELLKADIPTNYKIPTYGTQKAGDFGQSMVLDVHEAAGQTRGSRYHPYFTEQGGFGPTEYGAAESQMLDIAQGLGLPGGTAQAGRWFGGGELTGLKSPRGDALDLLERQTAYTLASQGVNPTPRNIRNTLLDMIETGQGLFLPYFKKEGMPDLRVEKKKGGAVKKRKVKITNNRDAQLLALMKKG